MSRRYRAFVLITLFLVLPAAAFGQEPSEPQQQEEQQQQEPEIELPTYSETIVVTASKVEQELINAPATISVVTSETIENSPAQNYGDLLRSIPGINVAQTSARDINITTRGATSTLSTSQLALLDGRSVYHDFFGFVAWDFLPVDTSEIAQIEVIRGPASAVWGANAMTGVINVITKTPRELDGTSVSIGFGAMNRDVEGNDLDTGTSFHVNATHAEALNDRWAYKVSAGVRAMDAFPRPTGNIPNDFQTPYPPFPNDGSLQPKFDARVDYDFPDSRQKLIFAGGVAGSEGIMHTGIGPFQIERGAVLGYAKVNYQRDNWKLNFFTNIFDGNAPALLAIGTDGQPINFLFDNKTYDVEVGNSQVLSTKHILTYGGNFRYNAFELSIAPRGNSRTEGGFYIQDEIFISDMFRWLVGGRVDRFSVIDKFFFSPRTTFMIKPTSAHAFRVSYNKAFRTPSFVNSFLDVRILNSIDLGLINPALAGQPFVFPILASGNEDLNEESLTAYEIGYTGTFNRRYTLGVAFYVNQTRDSIFFTQGSTYDSTNPPPGWPLPPIVLDLIIAAGQGLPSSFTYLNFDKVTNKGVELSLDAQLNNDVNVFTNYSWQGEPDPEGFDISELNLPPTHRFNAGFNFSRGRYFGNLSVSFTDEAFWQDVLDARFHGPTESYTLTSGGFGIRFDEDRITVAIKVSNISNTDAQQHVFGDIIKRHVVGEVKFKF